MFRTSTLWIAAAGALASAQVSRPILPIFSRVEQVRALAPEEDRRGYPVHLHVVVTYFDRDPSFALQAGKKGLDLACEIPTTVPEMVHGDPTRLRQVATNHRAGEVALEVEVVEHGTETVLL
jgi:hypothetical protein